MSSDSGDLPQSALSPSRRRFLELLSILLGAIAAGLIAVPVVGAYLAPLLDAPKGVWRTVGKVADFPVGTYVLARFLNASPVSWAGVEAKNAVWLRREPNNAFVALDMYCQHLGCPVRWVPGAQMFFCPCHGGVYYANGNVAAGPPPRALQRYPVRVLHGEVQVFTAATPYPG